MFSASEAICCVVVAPHCPCCLSLLLSFPPQIRKTEVASVLPVAFAGGLKVEGPVCENGKAVKWHASWGRER